MKVAEHYCAFVETEKAQGFSYLIKARDVLLNLYANALKLPDVPVTSDVRFEQTVAKDDRTAIFEKLASNIGNARFYWETFDPTEELEQKPTYEDLMDDMADIYWDLKTSLQTYKLGTPDAQEHALWEMKFTFGAHWGYHNINALRALHYWISNG